MAIDPAPVDIFQFKGFSGISIPMAIINLGQADKIPTTVQAAGVAKVIPTASYSMIEDASHYSMFAQCKPARPKSLLLRT